MGGSAGLEPILSSLERTCQVQGGMGEGRLDSPHPALSGLTAVAHLGPLEGNGVTGGMRGMSCPVSYSQGFAI